MLFDFVCLFDVFCKLGPKNCFVRLGLSPSMDNLAGDIAGEAFGTASTTPFAEGCVPSGCDTQQKVQRGNFGGLDLANWNWREDSDTNMLYSIAIYIYIHIV